LPPGQYEFQDGPWVVESIIVDELGRQTFRSSYDSRTGVLSTLKYLSDGTSTSLNDKGGKSIIVSVFNEKGWIVSQDDVTNGISRAWDYDAAGFIKHSSVEIDARSPSPGQEPETDRVPDFSWTSQDEYFGPYETPALKVLTSDTEGLRVAYDLTGTVTKVVHSFETGALSKTVDQWDDSVGARIPHRHVAYDQTGKIVLEDRFDKAGVLTYETKTLLDGAHYAMNVAADGTHIQITETDGAIRLQEVVRPDGSLFVSKLSTFATVESTPHNDVFTSSNGGATFIFADGFGQDVIRNFHADGPHQDRIIIETGREVNLWSHNGTDTIITVGNGGSDTIILKNVTPDHIALSDLFIV
jgi:hypothetical protein